MSKAHGSKPGPIPFPILRLLAVCDALAAALHRMNQLSWAISNEPDEEKWKQRLFGHIFPGFTNTRDAVAGMKGDDLRDPLRIRDITDSIGGDAVAVCLSAGMGDRVGAVREVGDWLSTVVLILPFPASRTADEFPVKPPEGIVARKIQSKKATYQKQLDQVFNYHAVLRRNLLRSLEDAGRAIPPAVRKRADWFTWRWIDGEPAISDAELLRWIETNATDKSSQGREPKITASTDGLKPTEKAVLDIIADQPDGEGMSAKEIVTKLKSKRIHIKEDSLRKHILPKLKPFGVINHRAAGGYLIPSP